MSFGIVIARYIPYCTVTQLYNNKILYSILFLLLIALILNQRIIRCSLFFYIGILLISYGNQKEQTLLQKYHSLAHSSSSIGFEGRVTNSPLYSHGHYHHTVSLTKMFNTSDTIAIAGTAIHWKSNAPCSLFASVQGLGSLLPIDAPENPYGFDRRSILLSKGLFGICVIDSIAQHLESMSPLSKIFHVTYSIATKTIEQVRSPQVRVLLYALFLGDRSQLDDSTKEAFRRAGIFHLLALSGLHVGILATSLMLLFLYIPCPRPIKIGVTILLLWAYLLFVGALPSLFRAVIMATFILLATLWERRSLPLNALGIAGIAWLVISPYSLFTPGFQLSFVATFSIITLYPFVRDHFTPNKIRQHKKGIGAFVYAALFVSMAGFIGTAPLLSWHFGHLSVVGLIANIGAVFLMTLSLNLFFAALIVQVIWPTLSHWIMIGCEGTLSLLVKGAELSCLLPFSQITTNKPCVFSTTLYCTFFISLVLVSKQWLYRLLKWWCPIILFFVPLIGLIHTNKNDLAVIFFKTKEYGLTGIRFPNNRVWLIDEEPVSTVKSSRSHSAFPWLRAQKWCSFDALILPHMSNNSIHTLHQVINNRKPNMVIVPKLSQETKYQQGIEAYLKDNNVECIQAKHNTRFVPSPRCTVTIHQCQSPTVWYEQTSPTEITITYNGITMALVNNRKSNLFVNDFDIVKSNNRISVGDSIYNLDSMGAVTIKINRKGILQFSSIMK